MPQVLIFAKLLLRNFNAIILRIIRKLRSILKKFYKNLVIRYKYNTDEIAVDVNTNNLKTEIKAYGKNRIVQLKAMIEKVKVRIKVLNTYINHQILISGEKSCSTYK